MDHTGPIICSLQVRNVDYRQETSENIDGHTRRAKATEHQLVLVRAEKLDYGDLKIVQRYLSRRETMLQLKWRQWISRFSWKYLPV